MFSVCVDVATICSEISALVCTWKKVISILFDEVEKDIEQLEETDDC